MIFKILRLVILFLLLNNMTAFALTYLGTTMGAIFSALSSVSLLVYYFFSKPWHKPALPFIIFSLLFFTISSFNYTEQDTTNYFIKESIRFMIVVICGVEVMYRSKTSDFFYILLVGAFSVIITAVVFPESNAYYNLIAGRYSGFYLNPNSAGYACLMGYALSYTIKSKQWRLIGQFAFTLGGIFTLSRTFFLVWILINLVSIIRDKKNIYVPMVGVIVLIIVFSFTNTDNFASDRFEALGSFFDDGPVQTQTLQEDSRTATWAMYYDLIMDKPFFGNGFTKFQRNTGLLPGVHNTYLLVIGEAGIIPFLVMIGLYGYLFFSSLNLFKTRPELFYIMFIVMLSMLVAHGYFYVYNNVLLSIYVYVQLRKIKEDEKDDILESFSTEKKLGI